MKKTNSLPDIGFVRLNTILGNLKADPPIPPIIPVSRSSWFEGVAAGRYPRPVRLSERVSAYKVEDIRALIEKLAGGEV